MSVKELLKSEIKAERKKLKSMSLRDKLWYIWEYYKFHMFGLLAILSVFWIIGTSIYRSTFDNVLYCMYINNYSDQDLNTDILTDDFHEYMNFTDKQMITAESAFVSYGGNTTEFSYASMAKISALISSKELDIMIGDQENFDHYAAMGGFADLKQNLPSDLLELVRDRLVYADDDTGTTHAYGITLDGTRFAKESNLTLSPCILTLVSNSGNKDNSIALLRYIFSE